MSDTSAGEASGGRIANGLETDHTTRRRTGRETMVSIEVSAEIVSSLEAIAREQGFGTIEGLLLDVVTSYSPAQPPTVEERQDALEAAYRETIEGEAEAWASGLLRP